MKRKNTICFCCGKDTILKRFCFSCRSQIPSGLSLNYDDDTLAAEIKKNATNREAYKRTTGIGNLGFDTENNIFHIDNAYYKVYELAGYSFYMGEPRFHHGMFGYLEVRADIYFSFTPIGQERRIRKVKAAVPCRYYNSGVSVSVEPPTCMIAADDTFKRMIANEHEYLLRSIALQKAFTDVASGKR